MQDGDGVITKTKDTIEPDYKRSEILVRLWAFYLLAKGECKTRLFCSFTKFKTRHHDIADSKLVVRDKAFHRTRPIVNLEGCAVLLVGGRRGGVVLAMEEACN